jgi:hypothetical protein
MRKEGGRGREETGEKGEGKGIMRRRRRLNTQEERRPGKDRRRLFTAGAWEVRDPEASGGVGAFHRHQGDPSVPGP